MVEVLVLWFGAFFVFFCYMAVYPDARHFVGKVTPSVKVAEPKPVAEHSGETAPYQPSQASQKA
jgi:hypothetical protein